MAAQPETLLSMHLEREIPSDWIAALNEYLWKNAKRSPGGAFGCEISQNKLCSLLEKADASWGWPDAHDLESLFARYDPSWGSDSQTGRWKITVKMDQVLIYCFNKALNSNLDSESW